MGVFYRQPQAVKRMDCWEGGTRIQEKEREVRRPEDKPSGRAGSSRARWRRHHGPAEWIQRARAGADYLLSRLI